MMQPSLWGFNEDMVAINRGRRLVYICRCAEFIKIGYTTRPADVRVSEMRTGNPLPITVLGTLWIDDAHDDRGLHRLFARFHHRDEWFHATPESLALVERVITHHEMITPELPQFPTHLWRPCRVCGVDVRSYSIADGWPVYAIGPQTWGSIYGATTCPHCEAPFVLRMCEEPPPDMWGDPEIPAMGGDRK